MRPLTILSTYAVVLVAICVCLPMSGPSAFSQSETHKHEQDNSYGKGGKKQTYDYPLGLRNERRIITVEVRDPSDRLREEEITIKDTKTGKKVSESIQHWDCKGNLTYSKKIEYDIFGNETSFDERRYKDGQQTSGMKWKLDENGKKVTEQYDSETDGWKKVAFDAGPTEIGAPPDTSVCLINNYANQIVGGFNIIREDSTPENFNTYGVYGEYTNFPRKFFRRGFIGLRADLDVNFKQQNGIDLTKTSVLGGIAIVPFPGFTTADRVTISTQALFGVSHLTSSIGTVSVSNNSFTMKLGGALDVRVTPHFFIRPIGINYAPTFFGTTTQNNVQFTFGVGARF